ncbi:MAG: N-6 DNA methylase [bacterium]|nr:N-6 DNA methylase [bacterium]
MAKKSVSTEVDSYIYIKESLRTLGWDTRNPEVVASGQVYTQNQCLSNPEIKKQLNLDKPENIVKIRESVLWVIEAKRSHAQLDQALFEAQLYAEKLNRSDLFQVNFISGVAGNDHDSFLIKNRFFNGREFVPVTLNGVETSGLLSPVQVETILSTRNPDISNAKIDERLFLTTAERINEILHLGAVNPHQRASVMAALLLSTLSSTTPNIEGTPMVLINDINARVEDVLRRQGKGEFINDIKITPPTTTDNHFKLRQALVDTLQALNTLNIRSAMRSGDDWLGAFYEVFLKYANWAQDLGIVLTPRHITKFIADVMDIQANDLIYDPTCGTGGFLVAALDYVKQHANETQLARFKQYSVFGIEQDSGVAALAVVNMIFRGDGKNNIQEGNCFAKFLEADVKKGIPTAEYINSFPEKPPITKVMMNPPFALKRDVEKEFRFIDQALKQMEHGGILFSILPYSLMVKPHTYLRWRRDILLKNNTLLAVVTFPVDLFYPVAVPTVGIFVKKGVPHPNNQNVLWVRALNDGLLKSKGKRLPNNKVPDDLESSKDLLRAFIRNPAYPTPNMLQFQKAAPIDFNDSALELVPEVYLDQSLPNEQEIMLGLEKSLRQTFAYLIKIDVAQLSPEQPEKVTTQSVSSVRWQKFGVEELFKLEKGHFHSIAALNEGEYPTISRVSDDNGFVGFYELPEKAKVIPAGTITVSTVSGDAFVQPIPFIATDNVVLCIPTEKYEHLSMASRYFIAFMIDRGKWRYSYGRQCYKKKFAKTEILLPVTAAGEIDEVYMENLVKNTTYWPFVQTAKKGQVRK